MWGVVVVILLGIVFYLAFSRKDNYQASNEVQPAANEIQGSEEGDATEVEANSAWKTYTNSEFSFEFQYPSEYYIVGEHTLLNHDAQLLSNYEREEDNNLPNLKEDAENIFFETYTVAQGTTLDGLKPKTNLVSFEKFITKAGLEGRKVVVYSEDQPVGNHTYFVFLQNNRVIHFSLGSMSEDKVSLLEDILATFKFTTAVQAEWKLYKNVEYGFSIEVPADTDSDGDSTVYFTSTKGRFAFDVRENQYETINGKQVPITFKDYFYFDHERSGEGKLGGKTAAIFKLPNGYCDGPGCTDPFIAYSTDVPVAMFYNLVFYGDVSLNATEKHILESFKFTK